MLHREDVHLFLQKCGIKPYDTVLIHTSMRALGEVENGCDGLIDAFVSYLSEGLFIVPTHTWATVGKESPVYDVRESEPCIGALPRVAAKRGDGIRSLHPTHSVAAFGKNAEAFVAGEENSKTPCPIGGVWQRLLDEKAKILLIGVGLNRNTYIHAIDEMLELPGRLTEPFELTVIDYDGKEHKTQFSAHNSDMTGSENFGNFEEPLIAKGALKKERLGNASVYVFDTVKGTEVISTLWKKADYHLCLQERKIPAEYYL